MIYRIPIHMNIKMTFIMQAMNWLSQYNEHDEMCIFWLFCNRNKITEKHNLANWRDILKKVP